MAHQRLTFKEARERVAQKWARLAVAFLAQLTRDADSDGPPLPGFNYSDAPAEYPTLHGPRVLDPLVIFDDETTGMIQRETVTTPSLRLADIGLISLRTLYPQLAEHPSHSRVRAQLTHRSARLARRDHFANKISERNRGAHVTLNPSTYFAYYYGHHFEPRETAPPTDAVLATTRYVREIGVDEEGNRLVTWKADHVAPHAEAIEHAGTWRADQYAMESARSARRTLHDLERQADDLIRAADLDEHFTQLVDALALGIDPPDLPTVKRIDVLDVNTRQMIVAPDAVAFRGVNRYRQPAPVRYHAEHSATYSLSGDWTAPNHELERDNALGVATEDVTTWQEFRTDVTRRLFVRDSLGRPQTADVYMPHRVVKREGEGEAAIWWWDAELHAKGTDEYKERVLARPVTLDAGLAFIGFRKIRTGAKVRNQRKASVRRAATTLKRGDATGSRGPARDGWTLSDRSLPRAWSKADAGQRAVADSIIAQLVMFGSSTLAARTDITRLSETFTAATDGVYAWRIDDKGNPSRAFTIQAFARRAAVAREDVS